MVGLISFFLLVVSRPTYAEYLSPPVWKATKRTLLEGELAYQGKIHWIAPGLELTFGVTGDLLMDSGTDIFNTFYRSPGILKTIYYSGLVGNFLDYRDMVSNNWNQSKLSLQDFYRAKEAYIQEGNWGIFPVLYHSFKGASRTVWFLVVLNSSEAVYKIVEAGVETVYYLLRYPVQGVLEGVLATLVLVGGSAWSGVASLTTTAWGLPFTAIADVGIFMKDRLWEK